MNNNNKISGTKYLKSEVQLEKALLRNQKNIFPIGWNKILLQEGDVNTDVSRKYPMIESASTNLGVCYRDTLIRRI